MTNQCLKLIVIGLLAGTLVLQHGETGRAQGPESGLVGDTTPTWSPTGELIAFVSTREVKPEVYVMNADGSDQRQLTSSPLGMGSSAPAWSPGGRHIAFVTGAIGVSQISIMNADGSSQRRLVSGGWNTRPAWSPDGQKIAFLSNRAEKTGVYMITGDGGQPTNITSELPSVTSFSWSRDSKRVAFATEKYQVEKRTEQGGVVVIVITLESRICVVDANGRNLRTLTITVGATNPSWSPRSITMDELLALRWVTDPQLSPDGNHIAFVSTQDRSSQIFIMNPDGSGRTQLTFAGKNQSPVWSPDGHRISFISDREGTWQIFIMNADGDRQTRLTGSGESKQSAWSPDGRRIVYSTKRGDLWYIFRVDANGTGETQLSGGQ